MKIAAMTVVAACILTGTALAAGTSSSGSRDVVLVTHDSELAAIADVRLVLRDGRVAEHITADMRVGSRSDR